jgi:hypothetical protein
VAPPPTTANSPAPIIWRGDVLIPREKGKGPGNRVAWHPVDGRWVRPASKGRGRPKKETIGRVFLDWVGSTPSDKGEGEWVAMDEPPAKPPFVDPTELADAKRRMETEAAKAAQSNVEPPPPRGPRDEAVGKAAPASRIKEKGNKPVVSEFTQAYMSSQYEDVARFNFLIAPHGATDAERAAWTRRPTRMLHTGSPPKRRRGCADALLSPCRLDRLLVTDATQGERDAAQAERDAIATERIVLHERYMDTCNLVRCLNCKRRRPQIGWRVPQGSGPLHRDATEPCCAVCSDARNLDFAKRPVKYTLANKMDPSPPPLDRANRPRAHHTPTTSLNLAVPHCDLSTCTRAQITAALPCTLASIG